MDAKDIGRFWEKVKIGNPDECWPWMGSKHRRGYGFFYVKGKMFIAHRLAWEFINGEIPDGLEACHHCDNPPCCNPAHLFLGTHRDNMLDREKKGRGNRKSSFGEKNGQAKLTKEQVKEIRELYSTIIISHKELASRFEIGHSQISNIIRRINWVND